MTNFFWGCQASTIWFPELRLSSPSSLLTASYRRVSLICTIHAGRWGTIWQSEITPRVHTKYEHTMAYLTAYQFHEGVSGCSDLPAPIHYHDSVRVVLSSFPKFRSDLFAITNKAVGTCSHIRFQATNDLRLHDSSACSGPYQPLQYDP